MCNKIYDINESGLKIQYPHTEGFFPDSAPNPTIKSKGIRGKRILVSARPRNNNDLMSTRHLIDAIKRCSPQSVSLFLPYVHGARQDRATPDTSFGMKVYADIINTAKCDKVIILDPHSDVVPALINNVAILPYNPFTDRLISHERYKGVLCPDAGAAKRVDSWARAKALPVFYCSKKRDVTTGKLSGFTVPQIEPGHYLIMDDICDGGGTFIGLAKTLDITKWTLDLYVTHGIFSKGVPPLMEYFKQIYTTDSILNDDLCQNAPLSCSYRLLDNLVLNFITHNL